MFLDALEGRLGAADARRVFADLRAANDTEAPVSVRRELPASAPAARRRRAASSSTTGASGCAARGAGLRLERASDRCEALARPGIRSSSPGRRWATSSPSSSPRWSSRARASPYAGRCSRESRSSSSDAVPTSRGARRRRRRTTSTSSSKTLCEDDVHYLYRGQCEPMRRVLRGDAEGAGSARPGGLVQRDGARPGGRLRDGRGQARRDLGAAVDARTRAPEHARVLRPQHRAGDVGEGLPVDDERGRVQLQLVLRRRSRHRALLERPAARFARRTPIRRSRRTVAEDYDWRGYLPFAGHAQAINPPLGRDPQLEQQARAGRRRGRLELRVRLGASSRPLGRGHRGAQEAHARHRHRSDEQGGHAGSASGAGLACDPRGAADRSCAERARRRRPRLSSTAGAQRARAGSIAIWTGRSTIPARP